MIIGDYKNLIKELEKKWEQKIKKLKDEFKEKEEQAIKNYNEKLKKEKQILTKSLKQKLEQEKREIVFNKELKYLKRKEELKQDLLLKIIERVKEKIKEMQKAKSKEYKEFFMKRLKQSMEELGSSKYIVEINKEDAWILRKKKDITIKERKLNSPGFIIYTEDKSRFINNTIDEIIKNNAEEFHKIMSEKIKWEE